MEPKKQIKITLKLTVIIIMFIILLISIIGIGIYIKMNQKNNNAKEIQDFIIPNNQTKSEITYDYDEVDGFCRIKGKNSNLLYKNEYESDTSYSEKIIYLDEKAKANMLSSVDVLDANEVLDIGAFEGEFIRVKYDSNLGDYKKSIAYMEDGGFYKCTTNRKITKTFDKSGNEVDKPKIDFDNFDMNILSNISNIYTLYDITTNEGEEYIVGLYDEVFADNNPNVLLITVVLKKQNANIDIGDEEQVKNFWGKYANYKIEENTENNKGDYEKIDINGKTYYHRLTENTWDGEYYYNRYYTSAPNSNQEVVSYKDYIKCINEINANVTEEKIEKYYTDEKSNYIILSLANNNGWSDMEIIDCIEENNQIIIYGVESIQGFTAESKGYFIAIPTNMPVGTEIQYRECYSTSEISNLKNYGTSETETLTDKPIIYLYPTEEKKVSVKLLKAQNLTCSYPKYQNEWNVLAEPNGNLKDLTTNRQLYSLYYENKNLINFKIKNDGFVIKGEDTINFLEEKLAILGLTERETEEFIVYWLPKLEANKYNYIRFATLDEINENMPLQINPNPDTIIRVLMTFKGLENPISVKEQQLEAPNRTGFVAVEWGGTEIK